MKIAYALALAGALAAPGAWAQQTAGNHSGKVLYRYTDDKGVQVLDQAVPPRYVAGGYEVLTLSGRVIEVVPPQATGEELAEQQRREAEAEEDRALLSRYNSVADIESARSRKLAVVEQDMAVLRGSVANLRSQIEHEETAAARIQRNGGTVPPELLARIRNLNAEIQVLNQRLERREQEAQQVKGEFDRAAARYAEISAQLSDS